MLERFGVVFEQYRGDAIAAQFFEPVGLFFKCGIAMVHGLLAVRGFSSYDNAALPFFIMLLLLYSGLAVVLTAVRPYIDLMQNIKEAVATWLLAIAQLLMVL